MIAFILKNKKKLLSLVAALLSAAYYVAVMAPGDSPDAALKAAQEKVEAIGDALPADAE